MPKPSQLHRRALQSLCNNNVNFCCLFWSMSDSWEWNPGNTDWIIYLRRWTRSGCGARPKTSSEFKVWDSRRRKRWMVLRGVSGCRGRRRRRAAFRAGSAGWSAGTGTRLGCGVGSAARWGSAPSRGRNLREDTCRTSSENQEKSSQFLFQHL